MNEAPAREADRAPGQRLPAEALRAQPDVRPPHQPAPEDFPDPLHQSPASREPSRFGNAASIARQSEQVRPTS